MEVTGKISANNAECVIQFALMGMGILRMNEMAVGDEIRKGALVPVLVDAHHVEGVPLHAVYPPGRHRLPRVAAMVDFLVESFGHAPWRIAGFKAKRR
jgi:DNA-binding transcriptional LysR family regulator